MERTSIFIIGDTLFAETLGYALASTDATEIVGTAPTPESALAQITRRRPTTVIVAGAAMALSGAICQLFAALPDLRIIRADLAEESIQVITCRHIGVHTSELVAAIRAPWERC